MYDNGKWDNPKVAMYCQVGGALDMVKFSINSAISNSGLNKEDFDIFFICWKTSDEVYDWLKENNYKYVDMDYDEHGPFGDGSTLSRFVWNLYKGWNLGYEVGFKHSDYVCPIATDHAFYKNWLANLLKNGRENRIVNCKLVEPGEQLSNDGDETDLLEEGKGVDNPSLHSTKDFGLTIEGEFNQEEWEKYAEELYAKSGGEIEFSRKFIPTGVEEHNPQPEWGRRLDAMPFLVARDVWERFGPMNQVWPNNESSPDPRGVHVSNMTGDTDFFNRCEAGGVEVTKALDAISYHCGGAETQRNMQDGVY